MAPALIKKLQERAREEVQPIYLEASNEGAKKVHEKLGFKEIESVIIWVRASVVLMGRRRMGRRRWVCRCGLWRGGRSRQLRV